MATSWITVLEVVKQNAHCAPKNCYSYISKLILSPKSFAIELHVVLYFLSVVWDFLLNYWNGISVLITKNQRIHTGSCFYRSLESHRGRLFKADSILIREKINSWAQLWNSAHYFNCGRLFAIILGYGQFSRIQGSRRDGLWCSLEVWTMTNLRNVVAIVLMPRSNRDQVRTCDSWHGREIIYYRVFQFWLW